MGDAWFEPGVGPWANVWLGTTAENQEYADIRIRLLLESAVVHIISAEPLLGPITSHPKGSIEGSTG